MLPSDSIVQSPGRHSPSEKNFKRPPSSHSLRTRELRTREQESKSTAAHHCTVKESCQCSATQLGQDVDWTWQFKMSDIYTEGTRQTKNVSLVNQLTAIIAGNKSCFVVPAKEGITIEVCVFFEWRDHFKFFQIRNHSYFSVPSYYLLYGLTFYSHQVSPTLQS